MKVIKTSISDVVILEPRVFGDERGYFFESFSQREFNEQVAEVTFVQDNESKSSYGVVRGLHYQLPPYTQAKLVRVVEGEVLDVVVDLRKNSATFGKHGRIRHADCRHTYLGRTSYPCHEKFSGKLQSVGQIYSPVLYAWR